jgi:hypothetical protein
LHSLFWAPLQLLSNLGYQNPAPVPKVLKPLLPSFGKGNYTNFTGFHPLLYFNAVQTNMAAPPKTHAARRKRE